MTKFPPPLSPSIALLAKVASLAVHIEEGLSESGHPFDYEAIKSILGDEEVKDWLAGMEKLALTPVRRNK